MMSFTTIPFPWQVSPHFAGAEKTSEAWFESNLAASGGQISGRIAQFLHKPAVLSKKRAKCKAETTALFPSTIAAGQGNVAKTQGPGRAEHDQKNTTQTTAGGRQALFADRRRHR
ncbi:hypothetical protein [Sedimentitalea nanhaiensis]|uniref:hypothetical protein n=1 Tax=Sedimentitalea nanhaiensis TaxID=999627 RepID=UPI001378F6EE|nr:hypothetical protein [Sedimentitalea nanhaiensis]